MGNRVTNEKIITAVSFAGMLVMDTLANKLPINGSKSWEIALTYPNLLTPVGYTFSIWRLIYLLLTVFTIYQLELFSRNQIRIKPEILRRVRILFSISSISKVIWILAWHYDFIAFSLVLIVTALICLGYINRALSLAEMSKQDRFLIKLPFSIYFGWTAFTTFTNVTALLVSIRWEGFGLPESSWTIVILILILVIASVSTQKNRDLVFCLPIIWAYAGLLVKHMSKAYLGGKYPEVIVTIIICIILLIIGEGYLYLSKKNMVRGMRRNLD